MIEFFYQFHVSEKKITALLSKLFLVSENNISSSISHNDKRNLYYVIREGYGAFHYRIEIYSNSEGVNEKRVIKRFAYELSQDVLMSDESLNPYSWLLITPNGVEKKVFVKVDSDKKIYVKGFL